MSRTLTSLASACLLVLAGCGYHTANSAVHLPRSVHTLAIPTFANNTQSYRTETIFTQAVDREFTARTRYKLVNTDNTADADATLHGTILKFDVTPLTYNSQTGQSSSYLITITTRVVIDDRDGRVLYQNPAMLFRQQYQTTQDLVSFIQEDPAAVQRLSRDFAGALVSDILVSFC